MWQPQGLYSQYLLRTPVLLSGKEAARGLYNYPGGRFAVIHGSAFSEESKELFKSIFKKKDIGFFKRSWKGEPSFTGLSGTAAELEDFRPDVIVAVGGGSVIDGSKLCRLLLEFPFFDVLHSRIDGSDLKTRFIAVPTTVGSGAEVSSAAVYWDEEKHKKEMVVIHELQPDVIVYDAEYVKGTPRRILCASALDGMSHIIEGCVSNMDNSMADVLGEKGLALFHKVLAKVIGEPDQELTENDYKRLQYAGYLGGIVQNHCIVGAAHAIAHQLTDRGYSHGEAVGLLLPGVIEANRRDETANSRYGALSGEARFRDVNGLISFLKQVLSASGIADRYSGLKKLLASLASSDVFIENVMADRGGKGNPVPITKEYIEALVRSL